MDAHVLQQPSGLLLMLMECTHWVDVPTHPPTHPQMYTGQRPYGSLKQQQLVEEVVMRGLRPKFPSHTPYSYVSLAQVGGAAPP
jgi:hypothetical protein